MDPTTKFEQAISLVLLPVSSQLAALHTSRTHFHSQCSCTRCGSELTTTRLVRSKRKRNTCTSRAILASCSACGATNSSPVEIDAPSFPSGKQTAPLATPQMAPPALTTSIRLSASQPSTKKRNKKPGLQEILQRNRDIKRKRTRTMETMPTSLTTFLTSCNSTRE